MFPFRKVFLALVFLILAVVMSGCAAVVGVGLTISSESTANDMSGIVEIGEIKMKSGANVAFLKAAKLSSAVFEKDMTTRNASPKPTDTKVNAAAADEVKRSLGIPGNAASLVTVRLKTYFGEINPWGWSGYYYWNITEKNTLSYLEVIGVRKLVNAHFILAQGNDTLLEVHGLWVGGDNADEIAGARQLAREVANAVGKKLNSPASRASTVEVKKE